MVDPVMLAEAALVEFDESAMHHHGGYDYTDKCLKLLFILLPDHKASKLSFICGEETAPEPTPEPTTPEPTPCNLTPPGRSCLSPANCCSNSKYTIYSYPHCTFDFCLTLMNIFC